MDIDPEEETCFGHWIKDKVLGRGGSGIVTLWRNMSTGNMIALKRYRVEVDGAITKRCKDRWTKEVDILRKLSHPNLVKGLPLPDELNFLNSDLPILCMEYCSRGDLRSELRKAENCCGLPESKVRLILEDIKCAIKYLHCQKVIHRDIKPENIVMKEDPDSRVVCKLIDLGYAKELDQNSLCSSLVGTLQYLAPELYTQVYTSTVDYWSFGLVCHEVITGFRPFLPHMSPVNWMSLVSKKSSDDVCVYQTADGSIVYSQEMYSENKISQPLRYALECWLRLALEWDGNKRGRLPNNSIVIFDALDDALKKKVVTVFSSTAFTSFGYEVDESTLVKTLKLWVERDTKQSASDQLILLPTGEKLSDDSFVIDCWNPDNLVAMLYVFEFGGLKLPNLPGKLPPLVSKMLESPKSQLPYHVLKRTWASAVFFLQSLFTSYQTLLEAYAVKMLSLILENQSIQHLESETYRDLQRVLAKHKLLKDSLQYDLDFKSNIKIDPDELLTKKWKENFSNLDEKTEQLQEVSQKLCGKIKTVQTKMGNLEQFQEPGAKYIEILQTLLDSSYKVNETLRKRSKNERDNLDSVIMAKIIFKALKVRDEMLTDQPFIEHLNQLTDCETSLLHLVPILQSLKTQIAKLSHGITNCQLHKQKDIWEIIYDLKQASGEYSLRNIGKMLPQTVSSLSDIQSSSSVSGLSLDKPSYRELNNLKANNLITNNNQLQPLNNDLSPNVKSLITKDTNKFAIEQNGGLETDLRKNLQELDNLSRIIDESNPEFSDLFFKKF